MKPPEKWDESVDMLRAVKSPEPRPAFARITPGRRPPCAPTCTGGHYEGGVGLLLNLGAWTGCMACLRSCPPAAIHEQTEWLPAAFSGPILLREGESVM